MKHFGDITKIDGHKTPIVDVVCGGSPCQDLSVAGNRAGLAGERSGLFMEQIRVVKEMREHDRTNTGSDINIRPRYMVWENVDGARSSGNPKGEDFRIVLEEICKIKDENATIPRPSDGKWEQCGCIMGENYSVAWRIHSAEHFGVPQRRKRICVLADFNGHTAPEIIFELLGETDVTDSIPVEWDNRSGYRPKISAVGNGLRGDSSESEQTREEVTRNSGDSPDRTSYTLKVRGGREVDSNGRKAGKGALIQTERSGTLGVSQDQTLITSKTFCVGGGQLHDALQPDEEVSKTLNCMCDPMKILRVDAIGNGQTAQTTVPPVAHALDCMHDQQAVMVRKEEPILLESNQNHATIQTKGVSTTLPAAMGEGGGYVPMVAYATQASGDRDKPSQSVSEETAYTIPSNPMSDRGQAVCYTVDQGAGKSSCTISENKAPTLACTHDGSPAVCYGLDRASFNQGQNAKYDFAVEEEKAQPLVARGPGGVLTKQ